MVVETLQTIDACIGIATCVIKVCQIAERYRNANQEGERTRETVQTIHNVLSTIKQTLQSRPQPWNGLSLHDHSSLQVSDILTSAENCNRNLQALISCVYGQTVTDLSILTNDNLTVQRASVVFRSRKIAGLNKRLDENLRTLTLSLQPIIIAVIGQQGHHQEARYEELMQQMREVKTLLQGGLQQQRASAESSRRSSASSDAIDSAIGNLENDSDASHTRDSMQNLTVLVETYDRLIRDYEEAEAAAPESLTASGGTPEASRIHAWASAATLPPKSVELDNKGRTKLIRSVTTGNHAKFSELLRTSSVDVNTADNQKCTALHHAVERGYIDIVKELLTFPAVVAGPATFVNLPNKCGRTALHECVEKESSELAEVLLQNRANANARTKSGVTPLLLALENTHPKIMVNLLLKHGAVEDFDHLADKSRASKARARLAPYQDQRKGNDSTRTGSTSNSTRAPSTSTSASSSGSMRRSS